jgi:hypothetical protein
MICPFFRIFVVCVFVTQRLSGLKCKIVVEREYPDGTERVAVTYSPGHVRAVIVSVSRPKSTGPEVLMVTSGTEITSFCSTIASL